MSGQPLVSVIVPVYNVAGYLEQCLESLVAQTLADMEVILVNDGSTDGSLEILRAAAGRDPRLRVIDKPNGGYGAAVNRGLDEARGEYVGIVEPDDFVDRHMYEDLYGAARQADGTWADVVKGSYWNYYDTPGAAPHIAAPNLMGSMPKVSFCSCVADQPEVLFHHPSVWSAIYRRGFLAERGIRMIEPRGAGWADNPWLYETLLQAERLVWVPAAYYYYRQTNPDASSKRLDPRLPFDRLRDVRAIYERLGVTDRQLLACLYNRTFGYIATVLGKFGHSEREPELRELILEALGSMDPAVLYGGLRGIRPEHLDFYELMMGRLDERVTRRAAAGAPRASVVVPMRDDRALLTGTLSALARQDLDALEVICVDCASCDDSRAVAEAFARRDGRFRVLDGPGASRANGVRAGVEEAGAPMTLVVLPGHVLAASHVRRHVEVLSGGVATMSVCGPAADALRAKGSPAGAEAFDVGGARAEVLAARGFSLSCCAFASGALRGSVVLGSMGELGDGLPLAVGALCRSAVVACARVAAPGEVPARSAFGRRARGDYERYLDSVCSLDRAWAVASELGDDALRALRCLSARVLLEGLRAHEGSADAPRIFEDARLRAEGDYGIWEAPRASYCNQDDLLALELTLCSPYEDVLRRDVARLRERGAALSRKLASVRDSRSYKLGHALVGMTRKVIPTALAKRLRG